MTVLSGFKAVLDSHSIWTGFRGADHDLRRNPLLKDGEWERAVTKIEKTADLLVSRLRLSDIIVNSAVAGHGQPSPRNLQKMCYRLVKCFEDEARSRGVEVWAKGESSKEVLARDSFESIPFLLIENAIKYAQVGTRIHVYVQDNAKSVRIEVHSVGFAVPTAERDQIFLRGFRGSNATEPGSGLGLWCAQIVAKAHDTEVVYFTKEQGTQVTNCFAVELKVPSGDISTAVRRMGRDARK